jgi:transcriptional regulator with XRE-family HTH domain
MNVTDIDTLDIEEKDINGAKVYQARNVDYSFVREVFGRNLIELRKEKGLNQEDVAKALGISRVALSHYERGERKPDIEIVYMVAEYFDVSIDYLFDKGPKESKDKDLFDIGFSEDAIERLTGEPNVVGIINDIIEHEDFQKMNDLIYMTHYKPLINEYETSYFSFMLSRILYSIIVDVTKDAYNFRPLSKEEKAELISTIDECIKKKKEFDNCFGVDFTDYLGEIDTIEEDLNRLLKKIKSYM